MRFSIKIYLKRLYLIAISFVAYLLYAYSFTGNNICVRYGTEDVNIIDMAQRSTTHSLKSADAGARSIYSHHGYPLVNEKSFDINGSDVMVFIHIQKTGGREFGKHLIKNIKGITCTKRGKIVHDCYRQNEPTKWLHSRFTTGKN